MPIGSTNWVEQGMMTGLKNVRSAGAVVGFSFDITNQFFHGSHPLGWMRSLSVDVDGRRYPVESVSFVLRQQRFPAELLHDIADVWWHPREVATVDVRSADGLQIGAHVVGCDLEIPTVIFTPVVDRAGVYRTMPARLEGTLTIDAKGSN